MQRHHLTVLLVAACSAFAQPKVGQPAPEIRLDQLLPDQPVDRASLSSLKGKAIVLEFWSTTVIHRDFFPLRRPVFSNLARPSSGVNLHRCRTLF
jgi:hypothetical protein